MLQIRAFVSGFVQGVNFRYYTAHQAKRLGLKGFARNTIDGRVEVLAQGKKLALERLVDWLQNGPDSASVEDVALEWQKPGKKFRGFSVKR